MYLTAHLAYLKGDADGYVKALEPLAGRISVSAFAAAVSSGRAAEAMKVLGGGFEGEQGGWSWYLLVHACALDAGDTATADAALKRAVKLLASGRSHERRLAKWLSREQKPEPDAVFCLPIQAPARAVVLTALAGLFPGDGAVYREMARRQNFNRSFAHLLIEKLVGETGAGGQPR
jgi:hypothetical protein